MKLITICVLTFLLSFNLSSCFKATFAKLSKSTNSIDKKKTVKASLPTPVISELFHLQKLYPGKDPILLMEKSDTKPKLKYFVVQGSNFYYGKNSLTRAIIEEQLDLKDLYDKRTDDAEQGKCCSRLTSIDFPVVKCKGCVPKPGSSSAQLDAMPEIARFCLEVDILNNVYWRICHRNKDKISRLKMALVRATVQSIKPDISPSVMTKILMNGSYAAAVAPAGWSWLEQGRWGGNCDSQTVQSPIPIAFNPLSPSTQPNFNFEWNFPNRIPFTVKGHGDEVVVEFEKGIELGYLRAKYGENSAALDTKDFKPVGISFRFPAEHVINGNRYDAEIILEFIEITANMDPKTRITEAFRWVFPVVFDQAEPLNHDIEELSADFWRFELEAKKSFIPIDLNTKLRKLFDLNDFSKIASKLKTEYAFYMGSMTTPPCLDRVLYLINLSPMKLPNCQFKTLRENSLTSHRSKETHARNLQDNIRGGPPEIRKIQWIEHKKKPLPSPVVIKKPHHVVVRKPVIHIPPKPNCEIKREIAK